MYVYIYRCTELYIRIQHDDDFKAMITMIIFSIELSCACISHSYSQGELNTGYTVCNDFSL